MLTILFAVKPSRWFGLVLHGLLIPGGGRGFLQGQHGPNVHETSQRSPGALRDSGDRSCCKWERQAGAPESQLAKEGDIFQAGRRSDSHLHSIKAIINLLLVYCGFSFNRAAPADVLYSSDKSEQSMIPALGTATERVVVDQGLPAFVLISSVDRKKKRGRHFSH